MDIRGEVPTDVLDYRQLLASLKDYSKPRDRIGRWLADGSLIRIRKGLYTFNQRYRQAPVSREYLANLIYGPSYVSLDYALSHYGLIPERVETVTSVTTGSRRRFSTPFGLFTYQSLPPARYSSGVVWVEKDESRYLMASPEKALVDKVWMDKRFSPANQKDFDAYLFDDLRLDEKGVLGLDVERLHDIRDVFSSRKVNMLVRHLDRRRRRTIA